MSYGVVPLSGYGGLDLRAPADRSACVDGVDFEVVSGIVKSRDGFVELTSNISGFTSTHLAPFYRLYSAMQLLGHKASTDDNVAAFDNEGTEVKEGSGLGMFFTRFGSPTAERIYFTDPSVLDATPIRRWDGSSFTTPSGMETGIYLAVQPQENRLVTADGGLTVLNEHAYRVKFSRELDAETWDDEFVDLDPGDGDPITGLVAWRDYLFAFKRQRFYVFYGNNTDDDGTKFNYRSVDSGGVGHVADRSPLVAAPDGVYFLDATGVYRTTGGPPQKVSGQLDPLFSKRGLTPHFSGNWVDNPQYGALAYHDGLLLVSLPEGTGTTNDVTYVFDGVNWMRWGFGFKPGQAVSAKLEWPTDGKASLLIVRTDGLWKWTPGAEDDDGTTFDASYTTGFTDLGQPGAEKDVAKTRLWGVGDVGVTHYKDLSSQDDGAPTVTVKLGASPGVGSGVYDRQALCTLVAHEFFGSGAWEVHRHCVYVRGSRPPGSRGS